MESDNNKNQNNKDKKIDNNNLENISDLKKEMENSEYIFWVN